MKKEGEKKGEGEEERDRGGGKPRRLIGSGSTSRA